LPEAGVGTAHLQETGEGSKNYNKKREVALKLIRIHVKLLSRHRRGGRGDAPWRKVKLEILTIGVRKLKRNGEARHDLTTQREKREPATSETGEGKRRKRGKGKAYNEGRNKRNGQ